MPSSFAPHLLTALRKMVPARKGWTHLPLWVALGFFFEWILLGSLSRLLLPTSLLPSSPPKNRLQGIPFTPRLHSPAQKKRTFSLNPRPSSETFSNQNFFKKKEALLSSEKQFEKMTHAGLSLSSSQEETLTAGAEASTQNLFSHGPLLQESPLPKLPDHLQTQALETFVLLSLEIDTEGRPQPSLLRSSQSAELDALALKTARTWKFLPARAQGKRIPSQITLKMKFEIE